MTENYVPIQRTKQNLKKKKKELNKRETSNLRKFHVVGIKDAHSAFLLDE